MKSSILNSYMELKGRRIAGAILSVFPPVYEEKLENSDIEINLELDNGVAFTLATDKNQWSCVIREEKSEPMYDFSDFENRMHFWMSDEQAESMPLVRETFKICPSKSLGNLIGKEIIRIEFLNIPDEKEFNPHGIKLTLSDGEFLISTCGHDGNIIQTSNFLNEADLINRFQNLGKTELIELTQ
ncbi:hypothetical protein [Flavobacterium sp. UBA7682]|uniref:hypothetical protein n=1 Tax=Flavobacterium sp. UBA7682 TaxID=1946560 RepID=UPI0025C1DD7A|nr:hypothetical protein [Flavobacterium sp. UBA7682]